ncbi:MAG: GNAT family N-acetyltransferase [Nitriliruptorales bacterium]|nr:GNAT family N-acetyltransferase [Nitriliruptorales bacterium]
MTADRTPSITRDDDASRYVLEDAPEDGFLVFDESNGRLILIHTEVADDREGQGIGSALVRFALEDAEERGLTVVPECNFVSGWLERHPDRAEDLDAVAA